MNEIAIHRTDLLGDRAESLDRQSVRLVARIVAIHGIEDAIDRAAHSDAGALVTGEAGVGKTTVARLVHDRSPRASASMVTLNCAGLPDPLLESDLFGHVRDSFTGAYRDKPGMLERAANGTLYLDDVGDLSTRMQVVLLRFLETGDIQRVGADRSHRRVDVRVVAASSLDLQARVDSGAFREDLYAGLSANRIMIPPLRERTEDIPLLLESFLRSYGRAQRGAELQVSSDAMQAMVAYRWPGNVRELRTVVERIVLELAGSVVRLCDLPASVSCSRALAIAPASRSTADDPRAARPTTELGSVAEAHGGIWI